MMMLLKTTIPPIFRPGAPELEEEVREARPEEPASVNAEPTEKKGKEKKGNQLCLNFTMIHRLTHTCFLTENQSQRVMFMMGFDWFEKRKVLKEFRDSQPIYGRI